MSNLTPEEKFNAILGRAQNIGLRKFGANYPKILADHKKNHALPGETIFEKAEDDPEYRKLVIAAELLAKKQS